MNRIVFVLQSAYEVKTVFSTHKYAAARLILLSYFGLVEVKVGVMCLFKSVCLIIVNSFYSICCCWKDLMTYGGVRIIAKMQLLLCLFLAEMKGTR